MASRTDTLLKNNKDKDIERLDAVCYENDIIVTKHFLEKWYGVQDRTVRNWFGSGKARHSELGTSWVSFKYFREWHKQNIDKTKSLQGKGHDKPEDYEISQEFLDTLPKEVRDAFESSGKDPLDALKDIKEIEKRDIANKKDLGKLVPAERLDSGMAELAMVFIGLYRDDLRTLPRKLEDKKAKEIEQFLDKHYEQRISDVKKIGKKGELSVMKITDLTGILADKLTQYSADEIIEKLNEL
jgi:hypothetical protein